MKNKKSTKINGRWDQYRSQKKQLKLVEKKIDNMDQETKDEKEFLDEELFDILQEVKGMMEKGELDEDHENGSDEEPAKPTTLGKLGKLAL